MAGIAVIATAIPARPSTLSFIGRLQLCVGPWHFLEKLGLMGCHTACFSRLPSRPTHACHRGQIAMRFTADIVFKPHVVAQGIDKAGLLVTGIILRIMDRDDCVRLIRRIRSMLRRARCERLAKHFHRRTWQRGSSTPAGLAGLPAALTTPA